MRGHEALVNLEVGLDGVEVAYARVIRDRRIEEQRRSCGLEVDLDVLLAEAQGLGHLIPGRVAPEQLGKLFLLAVNLIHRVWMLQWQPNHPGLLGQRVLDGGNDPPDGVGDELHAPGGVKLLGRLHEADIPLIDEVDEGYP